MTIAEAIPSFDELSKTLNDFMPNSSTIKNYISKEPITDEEARNKIMIVGVIYSAISVASLKASHVLASESVSNLPNIAIRNLFNDTVCRIALGISSIPPLLAGALAGSIAYTAFNMAHNAKIQESPVDQIIDEIEKKEILPENLESVASEIEESIDEKVAPLLRERASE